MSTVALLIAVWWVAHRIVGRLFALMWRLIASAVAVAAAMALTGNCGHPARPSHRPPAARSPALAPARPVPDTLSVDEGDEPASPERWLPNLAGDTLETRLLRETKHWLDSTGRP